MNITKNEIGHLSQDLLLETITINLRAVTISLQSQELVINFYYDQEPIEKEILLFKTVLNKFSLEFTSLAIKGQQIVLFKSEPIPLKKFDQWFFCRYEKNSSLFKIKTFFKEITKLNILIATQYALLGNVTENLRAISLKSIGNDLIYYFFYDKDLSNEDKYLSDVIKNSVLWSIEGVSGSLKRFVLPEPEKISLQEGHMFIYKRYEKQNLLTQHIITYE